MQIKYHSSATRRPELGLWRRLTPMAAIVLWSSGVLIGQAAELPPLHAPSVACAADGAYYLTGTHGINSLNPQHADFQNNDGVRLWKSADLKKWEDVGLVWSPTGFSPFHRGGREQDFRWMSFMRPDRDRRDDTWHHGLSDVSLCRVGNRYAVVLSMNRYGVTVLTADAPAGPYQAVFTIPSEQMAAKGSLFVDDDGTGYLFWGAGRFVRMKPDLTGVADEPQALRLPAPTGGTVLNTDAAAMTKYQGRYYFTCSAWIREKDKPVRAVLVSVADKLTGPFERATVLGRGMERVRLFTDAADQLQAVFSRQDQVLIRPVVQANGELVLQE